MISHTRGIRGGFSSVDRHRSLSMVYAPLAVYLFSRVVGYLYVYGIKLRTV